MIPTTDYTQLSEGDRVFEFEENGKVRRFIYDPDKMNLAQIADATTKLQMYDKMIEILPNTPNEFQEALKKEAYHLGLAALVFEVDAETNLKIKNTYYPNEHSGKDLMQNLCGVKEMARLEVCKFNFFTLRGIMSKESISQLGDSIKLLEKRGVSQDLIVEILKVIQSGKFEELENLVASSTPVTTSKKSSGKKRVRT